jgi:uncharacterized DUF497 family protein
MDAPSYDIEWDQRKNRLNQKKHGISFEEAATIFADPVEIMIDDPEHSKEEHRFISIGQSFRQRLLVVSYTQRGDAIRIINARKPTPRERRIWKEF